MTPTPFKLLKRRIKLWWWGIDKCFVSPHDYLVIGDSHAGYFRFSKFLKCSDVPSSRILQIAGATAYGLINERSHTQARELLFQAIAVVRYRRALVLSFGEVDCAFTVWKRAQQHGTTPIQEIERAVRNYQQVIQEIRDTYGIKPFIATVPPPTIEDWSQWKGEISNFRRSVHIGLEQRTVWTKEFNRLLREGASGGRYVFLDVEHNYLDPSTNLVWTKLRIDGDLHLDWERAAQINLDGLLKLESIC